MTHDDINQFLRDAVSDHFTAYLLLTVSVEEF